MMKCRVLALVLAWGLWGASLPGRADVPELMIDVGDQGLETNLGFGWGRLEWDGQRSFSWIRRLEGDVWFDLAEAGPADFELSAVPYFTPHRIQRIGLYVNGTFVAEWDCPHANEWSFEVYRAQIPEGLLVKGRNRITLRMGYTAGEQGRQYSIAVDYVKLDVR